MSLLGLGLERVPSMKLHLWLNAGVAALLLGFHYWAGGLAVKIFSGFIVVGFVYAMLAASLNFGRQRSVFGKPNQNFVLPDLELRLTYGLFRTYAETVEHRPLLTISYTPPGK